MTVRPAYAAPCLAGLWLAAAAAVAEEAERLDPASVIERPNRLQQADHREKAIAPLLGQPAPPLDAAWPDGATVDLGVFRGSVVVVVFWAAWSSEFVADVTETERLHREFRDRGVRFLGVHASWQPERMEAFARDHALTFPLAVDREGRTMRAWQADSFPDYYLVDPDGILRFGDVENDRLRVALEQVLREYPPVGPP